MERIIINVIAWASVVPLLLLFLAIIIIIMIAIALAEVLVFSRDRLQKRWLAFGWWIVRDAK